MNKLTKLSQGLGELRIKVYTPHDGNNYTKILFSDNQMEEFRRRSNIHISKLLAEGRIFDSLLPELKNMSMPILLIKGKHDPVLCEEQTQAFLRDVPNGYLKIYDESGHIPHYEEADRFAKDVIRFVMERTNSFIS
jgi:proline iminopeptidase